MADEDHDQLTATLGDELSEALERGQYLGVEIVRLDKPSDRLLGLADQFLQIASRRSDRLGIETVVFDDRW
jgi:hypothetical protein